jgi:hypothetical protein
MKKSILIAVSLFALSGPSCEGGTEVGNPLSIGLTAYQLSSQALRGEAVPAAGKIVVDAAWLAFRELKLRPAAACEDRTAIEVNGPLAVDLLGPIPDPLRNLPADPGGYCRVEFKWHKVSGVLPGAPAELNEVAVYVGGTRRDGRRFVIRSERNDTLELRGRGGSFSIEPTLVGLFVGFNMQLWLNGVDIDGAIAGPDNVVRIEKGRNEAQLEVFERNVATAAKLFKDRNGDGQLNSDESVDTAAVGDGVSR